MIHSHQRFLQVETTSYYRGNTKFFNDYITNVVENPIALRQIYEGLIIMDVKAVVPRVSDTWLEFKRWWLRCAGNSVAHHLTRVLVTPNTLCKSSKLGTLVLGSTALEGEPNGTLDLLLWALLLGLIQTAQHYGNSLVQLRPPGTQGTGNPPSLITPPALKGNWDQQELPVTPDLKI